MATDNPGFVASSEDSIHTNSAKYLSKSASGDDIDVEIEKSINGLNAEGSEVSVAMPPQVTAQPGAPEVAHHGMKKELLYSIDDVPPWYLSILLGFQHYLTMFGASVALPLVVAPALCMYDTLAQSKLICTVLFVSGIVTLLQATIGSRLPIVQGATYGFLSPIFAILSLPQWQCPDQTGVELLSAGQRDELWQSRMREIQGAIIVASVFEVLVGFSGVVGLLLKFIGPLAIAPTISLIGLSLFGVAGNFASKEWWTAIATIVLIALFSQYLRNVNLPFCSYTRSTGFSKTSIPFFKLFPVILGISVIWILCAVLTATGAFPENPWEHGYWARTDTKIEVLKEAPWFRVPYPLQWGKPTYSTAAVFGMLSGIIASIVESVGDYYACARLSGAPPPPDHAINRGIGIEGIGCILAGLWGSASGTTSYSENIGAIGITKVGSRRVIQIAAACMIVLGMLGKFGALFVTIPDPIVGGMFCVVFGMVTAVGMSNLQYVDLNSSRNLFILGFSYIFGLVLPMWLAENPHVVNTGSEVFDQIVTVLFSTSMFVGGFLGFVLDNTIPGTLKERGLLEWRRHLQMAGSGGTSDSTCYDFPCFMDWVRKVRWFRYVPICPTFKLDLFSIRRLRRKTKASEETERHPPGLVNRGYNDQTKL